MNEEQEVEEFIDQLAAAKASIDTHNFPEPPDKDDLLKFMRDVINEEDSIKQAKASNLKDEEVGKPNVPSLTYANLANYAAAEGYDMVSVYLNAKVGTISSLSLGRKAKLLETLFTTRRETKNITPPKTTTKKSLFGGEKTVTEGYNE